MLLVFAGNIMRGVQDMRKYGLSCFDPWIPKIFFVQEFDADGKVHSEYGM